MSRTIFFILGPLLSVLLPSCNSSNLLSSNFLDSTGVRARSWSNPNPVLQIPAHSRHLSAVSKLTAQGFTVIGYGQLKSRNIIDAENARLLAIEKNADVVVFSQKGSGAYTERVAVPIRGHSTASSYSNQYGNTTSSGSSLRTTAELTYKDSKYKVYDHKTTLLRARNKNTPVPPLDASDRVKSLPKTAPRPKLKSAPKPETYYLGWNSLLKPTNPS